MNNHDDSNANNNNKDIITIKMITMIMTIVNGTVLFIVNWRLVAQIQPWFSLWASLSPTTVFWCHWTTFSTRRWRVVVERWILLALAHAVGLYEDCRVFCPGKLLVVWLVFSLSGTARVIAGSSSWGCYCIWSKSVGSVARSRGTNA